MRRIPESGCLLHVYHGLGVVRLFAIGSLSKVVEGAHRLPGHMPSMFLAPVDLAVALAVHLGVTFREFFVTAH